MRGSTLGYVTPVITHPAPKSVGGKTGKQMTAEEAAKRDAAVVTVRCAKCPRWSWTGPYGKARGIAARHRERRHPELVQPRRRHPGQGMHRWQRLHIDDVQRAEAQAEVERRKATTHADDAA